ncbi:MAG: S41 family peptidase [Paludibacteraceae bacterium]|nr:S41 family peptidase [Paludibacteraceae bacterium]
MKHQIFIRVKGWLLAVLYVVVAIPIYGRQITKEAMSDILKFSDIYNCISNNYVDNVDVSKLMDYAIDGMLSKLDPHSRYLTAQQVKESQEMLHGEFEGIGVSYVVVNDTLNVVQVIDGGPAWESGIEIGDKILYANDVCIVGMTSDSIQAHIKGKRKTKVSLLIDRGGKTFRQSLARDRIPVKSVVAAYLVKPDVGLVRFDKFSENTEKEVTSAINDLKRQGAKKIIIDLRDNGGGLLYSAVEILSQFLPEGTPIVETKGSRRPDNKLKSLGGYQKFLKDTIVVLINQNTASASEIFAGAMQDLGRAKIVGCRSFGKGLVQQPYQLSDGSEIRLTTSRYYTPSGRCIQRPYKNGKYTDSSEYGINPDIYIEPDTVKLTAIERAVIKKQLLVKISLRYYLQNKEILTAIKTPVQLYNDLDVSEMLRTLESELLETGIDYTKNEFEEASGFFSLLFKGLMAEYLLGQEAYYIIMNMESDEVKAALDV